MRISKNYFLWGGGEGELAVTAPPPSGSAPALEKIQFTFILFPSQNSRNSLSNLPSKSNQNSNNFLRINYYSAILGINKQIFNISWMQNKNNIKYKDLKKNLLFWR